MSWLSSFFKKGFRIVFRLDWPGEKGLPNAPSEYPTVTKEEVEKEIKDSLNKGGKNGSV